MESLYEVLCARDGKEEAQEQIKEMIDMMDDEDPDPEEILYEFGLEPDYVFDLINFYERTLIVKHKL